PIKAKPIKTKPMEDTLPPLSVPTTSERLSDFLEGAVGSIMVPNKQEMASPPSPPQINEQPLLRDQPPLIENLRMPPTAPKFSRPERLQSSQPLPIPKTFSAPTPKNPTPPTTVSPEPLEPASRPQPAKIEPAVKPAPVPPELSPVTPFKSSQKESKVKDASPSRNLEESLKRTIPTVPTPAPISKIQRQPKTSTPQQKKSFVPEVSAPQLAEISPPPSLEKPPQREKMSDMMKQLLEEATVPNLNSSPAPPLPQQPAPSSSISTRPVQSEIDHRIAKLSIPNVTPVESIKERFQRLEVQPTSNAGQSSSQASPGKNQYLAMVEEKIDHEWRALPLVTNPPVVVLKFRISRFGEISNIHIDESSGNGNYDSAALRAVSAVNPLPPFPPDISDSFFEVRFRFIKKD
ncbi:MAG: TonB family protein, partial [Nitrospira sp.]|nr:TonB family protein [Nitrospira sp.]